MAATIDINDRPLTYTITLNDERITCDLTGTRRPAIRFSKIKEI